MDYIYWIHFLLYLCLMMSLVSRICCFSMLDNEIQIMDVIKSDFKQSLTKIPDPNHWRQEEKQHDGTIRGRYSYSDSKGYTKIVEYIADDSGFHVVHVKTLPPKNPHPDHTTTEAPHSPFLGPLPPFIPKGDLIVNGV